MKSHARPVKKLTNGQRSLVVSRTLKFPVRTLQCRRLRMLGYGTAVEIISKKFKKIHISHASRREKDRSMQQTIRIFESTLKSSLYTRQNNRIRSTIQESLQDFEMASQVLKRRKSVTYLFIRSNCPLFSFTHFSPIVFSILWRWLHPLAFLPGRSPNDPDSLFGFRLFLRSAEKVQAVPRPRKCSTSQTRARATNGHPRAASS
jgi:hypothetical protein